MVCKSDVRLFGTPGNWRTPALERQGCRLKECQGGGGKAFKASWSKGKEEEHGPRNRLYDSRERRMRLLIVKLLPGINNASGGVGTLEATSLGASGSRRRTPCRHEMNWGCLRGVLARECVI